MPNLADHQSNLYTKMLLIGDPGTGKTGCMTSLVALNYKLRILDMDNGLEPLKQFVLHECPESIGNVEYRTLRDKYRATPSGPQVVGQPRAFVDALKMLDAWRYDDVDLGVPATWGPETILVIDSLTLLGDAAFSWADSLNVGGRQGKDPRVSYKTAQDALIKLLALVTSEAFETNVIVIAHVDYVEGEDGATKGYPRTPGKAISSKVALYFNSVALCQTKGGVRTIQTASTNMIDLKNPKPFEMLPKYDVSTGLADFFKVIREPPKQFKLVRKV